MTDSKHINSYYQTLNKILLDIVNTEHSFSLQVPLQNHVPSPKRCKWKLKRKVGNYINTISKYDYNKEKEHS